MHGVWASAGKSANPGRVTSCHHARAPWACGQARPESSEAKRGCAPHRARGLGALGRHEQVRAIDAVAAEPALSLLHRLLAVHLTQRGHLRCAAAGGLHANVRVGQRRR